MKTFLQQFLRAALIAGALSAVPSAVATPTISITSPSTGTTQNLPGPTPTLTINATTSIGSSPVGTQVSSVTFFANGVSIGTVGGGAFGAYSIDWFPTSAGTFTLTATVTDTSVVTTSTTNPNLNTATSPLVIVTVTGFGPTISLTNPTSGSAVGLGSSVDLIADAVASGGSSITRVDFLAGTTVIGSDFSAPYVFTWIPSAAGAVNLTARATETGGFTAVSSPVAVSVSVPSVVLTSPLSGAGVTLGSSVPLTATASAVSPATVTKVDFLAGTTLIGTATTAPYSVNWTPTATGNVSLTARVTDSNGAPVTSAAVTVNVSSSPAANPTVVITSPTNGATAGIGSPLLISASATPGISNTISRVDFLAGAATIGTAFTPPYTTNWIPNAVGAVSLTARVTDSSGATATSPIVGVSVTSAPSFGVSLALVGSSSIPVGSTRAVNATVTGGGTISRVELYFNNAELVGTDTAAPYGFLFTAPPTTGSGVLTARAYDVAGQEVTSAPLFISITGAVGVAPLTSILSPSSGSFVAVGQQVTVSGTATDPDGVITGVQVYVNGATTGLASSGAATVAGSSWSITWTPGAVGVASIAAIATDNNGNAVAAPPVGVTVADSTSPGLTLTLSPRTAAVPGSTTLPSGAVRNIVADAVASSGRAIVRVEFFVDGTKVGEDTVAPYTYRYLAPELGPDVQSRTFVLSARATDNAGAARDVQVPLLVVSPIGQPPVVSLLTPTNNASVAPNTPVSMAATALATGGSIASVQFYVNGSPTNVNAGNAIPAAPYTTTFTPTAPGTYTIDAIATDDRGNTTVSNAATITAAFATPTVAITAPNPSATARATPNVPLNITATATVSTSGGAAILLVEFLLDGVQIGARTVPTNAVLGTYTFSWTPTATHLGPRVITARVTDTNSQTATSAPLNINVANLVGTPPSITIATQPVPALGLQTLSQVSFIANAAASATGVTISNIEFFLNDVSIGSAVREQTTNIYRISYDFSRFDFSSAPSITDPNTGVTRYTPIPVYAIARDSNNNQTVSTTANLTINLSTSSPPSLQLQALSQTTITQGQQFFSLPNFSDPDGTVTQIQLFANGTAAAGGTINNPQLGQTLTFTPATAGRFNLYAVATDDSGNTVVSSPAIVVTVNAVAAPRTTITRPANNATTTTVGAPVFLEGTAASPNPTLVPTLQFIITGSGGGRQTINGIRVGTTTTYRAIWTPTAADTFRVSTQANIGTTASGTSTLSRQVVVSNLIGLAPTIAITGPPTTTTTASTINLTATATDSDGSVVEVEFFVNRNSIGLATRDQLANTWRITASFAGVPLGAAEVVARARDSSGNVAASTTININVTAAASIAPSITITPSTTNAAFNRQVQLRANARDSDGTVNSVQYFANNTSLGTSTNAGTSYQVNWTPTTSGSFNVWAIATDNTGIITVAPTVEITVRRNNPVLEDAAFVLQTYQDILNTTIINAIVFDDLDARLGAGTLTRAELVVSLMNAPGFLPPVNLLAAYWVLMGQWPTPANYNTLVATARTNFPNAMGGIINSGEYFAKYGATPTAALLNNPASAIPADTFITRLWQGAGLGSPNALDNLRFRSNNVLTATLGRGYGPIGLNQAIGEFITNTNSGNTALFNQARIAALYYQLARPPITVSVDEITARINALAALPDTRAVADAILKDILYGYRYVTITRHPQPLVVNARSGAIFTVEAQGAPPLAYQWLLNGAPIPGANTSTLSLTNVSAGSVGTYTVAITSSAATATSDPATLTLATAPSRLANISTRGVTSGGDNVLIGGFVVLGANQNQTRQLLIRVVGPRLSTAPFNVAGVLANPRLEVYRTGTPAPVLQNDDWGTQAGGAAQVTAIQQATNRAGAFTLAANSADAAVLATLPPGLYTVQARGPANLPNASGVVLIEVYDVTQNVNAPGKASNVSTRGAVGTGSNILIAGFVVNGTASRRVLIRGVGPTLSSFGVPGVLADPQLTLIDQSTGATIRSNNDWATGDDAAIIAAASGAAGAFPLANGSRDSAMILMLPPGPYTVQLSGVNNTAGVGIVEVYDVDP